MWGTPVITGVVVCGEKGHQARNQLRSQVRALTAGACLQKTNVEAVEDANENERVS